MSWIDQKKDFERRYNAIDKFLQKGPGNNLDASLATLNTSVSNYIKTGGVSQNPADNQSYSSIIAKINEIESKKKEFINLNKDIQKTINKNTKDFDTGNLLKQNGKLQQDIIRLEKEKLDATNDAATANLRDSLLKERDTAITKHQLFFLNRPVRSSAIPILWGLSILFVAAAIVVFKQLFPGVPAMPDTQLSLLEFFMDSRIWMTLTAAAVIVIIFLVLKIVGVFDPKNKPKPVKTE